MNKPRYQIIYKNIEDNSIKMTHVQGSKGDEVAVQFAHDWIKGAATKNFVLLRVINLKTDTVCFAHPTLYVGRIFVFGDGRVVALSHA